MNLSPYDPIEPLEENLWSVTGSIPEMPMPLKRRMTLIKLSDGRLVIHSAILLNDDDMAKIEALGKPSILIVPSGFHRIDAPKYKARYPDIQVLCPKLAYKRVSQRVAVDGHYDLFPVDESVEVETLSGLRLGEGVFIVHSGAKRNRTTLLFNDAFFNQPHLPGFWGRIYRWIGSSGSPRVTPVIRRLFLRDPKAFKEHLLRLSKRENLVRIIPGHGDCVMNDPAYVLGQAAELMG